MKYIPYIIIVILCLMLAQQCKKNKDYFTKVQNDFEEIKMSSGIILNSQKVLEMENEYLQNEIIEKDAQLKEMAAKFSKIQRIQTISTKTTIPSIAVAFEQPIKVNPCDSLSGFKFERTGAVFNEWYELGYKVTQDSLTIEPFSTWTEIKRIDGFKRKWFLGKKTYHSDIMFTNPHVTVPSMQTYEVDVPVKWYETTTAKILFGVFVGCLIAN